MNIIKIDEKYSAIRLPDWKQNNHIVGPCIYCHEQVYTPAGWQVADMEKKEIVAYICSDCWEKNDIRPACPENIIQDVLVAMSIRCNSKKGV